MGKLGPAARTAIPELINILTNKSDNFATNKSDTSDYKKLHIDIDFTDSQYILLAIKSLGQIGKEAKAVLPFFINFLENKKLLWSLENTSNFRNEKEEVNQILWALEKIGIEPVMIPKLIYFHSKFPHIITRIIFNSGKEAAPYLMDILKKDKNEESLVIMILEFFGDMGENAKYTIPEISSYITSDRSVIPDSYGLSQVINDINVVDVAMSTLLKLGPEGIEKSMWRFETAKYRELR